MNTVVFKFFKRLTKALFVIYGDFECVLIPSTDDTDYFPDTKKYNIAKVMATN